MALIYRVAIASACLAFAGISYADNSTGYDIILLAGQSNMAGRGAIPSPIDPDGAPDAAIKMWDPVNGIVTAKDPIIHPEKGSKPTQVGMGMTFAKSYLSRIRMTGYPNRKILLVGAAWGGTSFTDGRWLVTQDPNVGGDLYRGAVTRANAAIAAALAAEPTSAFKGILWHQGESDMVGVSGASSYASNHTTLMKALRKDINGAANAPIVVGEMTPCLWAQCESSVRPISGQDRQTMLNYIHHIHDALPNAAWVSSAGLSGNGSGDQIHFNRVSQRELGRRYFAKYWEAARGYTPPVVDLKIYNGRLFNVGTSIDFDASYNTSTTSARVNGNVTVNGPVSVVSDASHGNVVEIVNSGANLKLSTEGTLFNGSYTKMAWFKLRSNDYRNHLISAQNPTQTHFLYTSLPSKYLSAGHSSVQNAINVYAQQNSAAPINVWTHVAVAYSASARKMVLYINGNEVSTTLDVQPATPATGIVDLNLSGFGGRVDFGLDGQMISNKVYDRALSANEVSAVHSFENLSQTGYGLQ